jgi:hypothetical protein
VRITSVIKDFKLNTDTYYLKKGYTSQIKTLGVAPTDLASNNWIFNISTYYEVQSVSLIDSTDQSYIVTTQLEHIFRIGDRLSVYDNAGNKASSVVTDIISSRSFNMKGQGIMSPATRYYIQRDLLKTKSLTFPNADNLITNIANVYRDGNKILVASPSIPYYGSQSLNLSSKKIIFSGTFVGDSFKITTTTDHGFYTGDAIYYTPQKITTETLDADGNPIISIKILNQLFDEGIYFVKRINSTSIKLSQSQSDLYNSRFKFINNPVDVTFNKLEYYKFKSKTLKSQNLFREIAPPINGGAINYPTQPGFTGILINGVEILNYKSNDILHYGEITEIEVIGRGNGYDIINPPIISISDPVGYGATAYCAVRGSLQEIRIIDPGFNYVETPIIQITGGNGVGAKAVVGMKLIDHQPSFPSESNSARVSLTQNIIGFGTYHKFISGEQVIYITNGQKGVGGLSTQTSYFISIQSPTEIKLHNSLNDAISGINTINLTSHGIGNHEFKSYYKKSVIGAINVIDSGFGYENKKKTVFSSITGINTSLNQINILNHEFQSGEIVKYVSYSSGGSVISGLTTGTGYYITKIDNDNFKLSEISTTESKDFYYKTQQFINLTSIGIGTHTFNYPEISVEVIGTVGVSSINSDNFKAVVQPIFRGEITSIHLENSGVGYGSSEVLNYYKQPLVTPLRGSDAQVIPIISDGKITEILIISSGNGYNSPPDTFITGNGIGAVLTPIVKNGKLIAVNVIESGSGYEPSGTSVDIIPAGSSSEFNSRLQFWNINLLEKSLSIVSDDDGFLSEGINEDYELQYSHIYAPRKLREIVYSSDSSANILYGKKDLSRFQNKEIKSIDHSPIIGWAYDGNPIYGPYGYSTKQGGTVTQMRSGYRLNLKPNRPSLSVFSAGFFIQDYTYFEVSDEAVLDKNNGRFCVTPEYPNGTYAYFATINESDADSSGSFFGYKKPVFPYLIGDNFYSKPNEFNFKKSSNQRDLDLNQTNFFRNTKPYNLIESNRFVVPYTYLNLPNLLDQTADIKYASSGSIETIKINSGGSGYKIGDRLTFDNDGTNGLNASAEVERISGKSVNSISVATTSIFNVEFYPTTPRGRFLAVCQNPHGLINTNSIVVSGLNTTSSLIEGSYQIEVAQNVLGIAVSISSTAVTGIVTYFPVSGNLDFPIIRENDILKIGTEQVKVLNVDKKSSRIRVLRAINGTVGSSHSITVPIIENSKKFTINAGNIGFGSQYDYKIDREIYFNPVDAVGLGTIFAKNVNTRTTTINSPVAIGATNIFVVDTTGIIAGVSSISVVGPGTIITSPIVSVASTFVQIGSASTVASVLGIGTVVTFSTRSTIGIGITLIFSNPGAGITQIFIPTKSIYIPNHQLNTGDELLYSINEGTPIGVSTNGISTSVSISDQSIVYVAKISDDLIGISTFRVGLGTQGTFVGIASTTRGIGTLFFTNLGTGNNHSFKTRYNKIFGSISKNTVTVSTAQSHGLLNNDMVFIDVNPSISTTFTIKYSDHAKKILINPKDFVQAGVNTLTNAITIPNHKFKTGQKVIHTADAPSFGLENNKEYFVFVIDTNNINLTNTYYDSINAKPKIVGITSSSNGTLSLVNPPIQVYRNSLIVFDVSDSSLAYTQQATIYPAFILKFFRDPNFTDNYDTSSGNQFFDIQRIGTVGITSGARVTLSINDNTPENLYYKLIPIYDGAFLPQDKKLIKEDLEVIANNQIQVNKSKYNGQHRLITASDTSFVYDVAKVPEENLYTSGISSIKYETNSLSAIGSISKIKITNRGTNYLSIPQVSAPFTGIVGVSAILEADSRSIGKVKSTKINDIGFDFPSDLTLRPSIAISQIVKIEPLSSLKSIYVSSFGKGYTSAPKLLVLDGKTGNIVPEVDLKYTLGNTTVEILNNSFGLYNVTPRILPIQNSNGVGISSIQYNFNTKNAVVFLSVGFSTVNSFPFAVNDKVYIENVSVGLNTTGKGYNSEIYNYNPFTITSVTENLGGLGGSITFNMGEVLNDLEFPGTYFTDGSSGQVIAEKYFPVFDVVLSKNNFSIGENVESVTSAGEVQDWRPKSEFLSILSKKDFRSGEIIRGLTSKTQGIAGEISIFDGTFNLAATSKFEHGRQSDAGVLNNNLQRIQDGEYYQKFSYSIKSRVDFDTWNDAVSTLNHTLGFVKFSDFQLESGLDSKTSNALIVNVPSILTQVDIKNDIIGVVNLNCVYDFDLVKENSKTIGSNTFTDEIIFSNRILSDYAESVGNRVLEIDDISSQFNSNPRPTRFSEVGRFSLADVRVQKTIAYVRDKRFTADRQVLIITTLIDNTGTSYVNQYARLETTYDMGSFDIGLEGTDGLLLFYPNKFSVNDFDVTTLSYNIDDSLLGIGSTSFGGVVDIRSSSTNIPSGSTASVIGIAKTYRSVKALISIAGPNHQYEYDELNIIHDGTNVGFTEYGQLTNTIESTSGLGTYHPYISGSNLKVDFKPNIGIAVTVNTIQVAFAATTTVGMGGTYDMKHARLEGRSTSIASTATPTSVVISKYPDVFDSAYIIVQVSDNTNNRHQLSEMLVVDDNTNVYAVEYGTVNTFSGLGTIGAQRISSEIELVFTPLPNIDVDVKVYLNALRYEDELKDKIDFLNSKIQSDYGIYEGTESSIKRDFNLTHKNSPIFEKYFDGGNSVVVDTNLDVISLPNHFFVTGELVTYSNAGAGTTSAIGIATTSFVSVGSTSKLPQEVYIVKVDTNNVRLARSAEDALKSVAKTLNITSVGIGSLHKFVATNKNSKVIVALDNIIQSPIVSLATTTRLSFSVFNTSSTDLIYFDKTTDFVGGDLVKIGDEIMRIESIGIGSTNAIRVRRPRLGTSVAGYSTGTLVTKVMGNYNIVDNILNFAEAPFGRIPLSASYNRPDERDWVGISTGSSFQGRSFIRSGIENSSEETYSKNYIFNDISGGFNGLTKGHTLISNGANVTGIANKNAIILINDVFQGPGIAYDCNLVETAGITSVTFTGTATSVSYDVNNASIPRGGVIVSVGSTEGFGYQPLVSAGGTAIVSVAGTISAISIGNSGSGYRASSAYEIVVDTSSSIGIGSTLIYLENANSVFKILNLLNTGSNCSIGVGTFIESGNIITSIGSTFIRVGSGATSAYEIPSGTAAVIKVYNPSIGIVNVGIKTVTLEDAEITHIGIASISNGRVIQASVTNNKVFYVPRDISNVGYTSITGITTITTSTAHGLNIGNSVVLSGIAFTCDYAPGVGIQTAIYDNITGIMTVTTSSAHGLSTTGKNSFVLLTGLGFTCSLSVGIHTYPRTTDPAYCGTGVISVGSATTFTINAGVSTVPTFYLSGGIAQPVIISPRAINNSLSGTDPAFGGTIVSKILNATSFEVNTGISTRAHNYSRCGKVNQLLNVVIDYPLSYSNIPLLYSSASLGAGNGVEAKINIVVGQGSNVIDFEIVNTGYGYNFEEIITVPIGGLTGIPTTGSSFKEFQLNIQKTFNDKFSGWSIGELQVLDPLDNKFNGKSTSFPITLFDNLISIRASKGSNITIQDTLLIFINDILQVPGKGYTFPGGSIITFTEPPKVGDTSKIIFYRGSGSVDVVDVDVIEFVKIGDELTINYDSSRGQSPTLQEEERTVTRIDSTDLVKTNPYFGPGNIDNQSLERPVTLCRQTEDKIINQITIGKSRALYEAAITPSSYLIKSVGIADTVIYVDNIKPFFNPFNENDISVEFQKNVVLVSQDNKVGASATAVVSIAGTITSIVISDGGVGYTTTPTVSISQPIGFGTTAAQNTALASATVSGGVVTAIAVTFSGGGYISTIPPQVLIESPSIIKETGGVASYAGDSGVIVGFGITTIGSNDLIIFDFHIPHDSNLRNNKINTLDGVTGAAVTISGIQIDDFFIVYNSNVGFASTAILSKDGNNAIIGIGTNFVDNIYQVQDISNVSVASTTIGITTVGTATTTVRRVFARISDIFASRFSDTQIFFSSTVLTLDSTLISGISVGLGATPVNYFGNFSWGKIVLSGRSKENKYNVYERNGVGGISTSGIVKRTLPLRFENYTTT